MVIAVDACFGLDHSLNKHHHFITTCFVQLAARYPKHQFIFITDYPFNPSFDIPKNIIYVIRNTLYHRGLLRSWWYTIKLPAILKRYKVDILINGSNPYNSKTKIPQILIVDPFDLQQANSKLNQSLHRSAGIVVLTNDSRQEVIQKYAISPQKIDVIPIAVDDVYRPIDFDQKEWIKNKYSQGIDYFLFAGPATLESNLIMLLKAFSHFKKWQKSAMRLLLVMDDISRQSKSFLQSLQTYKYKDDVIILDNLSNGDLPLIYASAYVMICTFANMNALYSMLAAIKCSTPVIAVKNKITAEFFGETILSYEQPDQFEELGNLMMLLYKDENKRMEMINNGLAHVQKYNWLTATDMLWHLLQHLA